MVDVSSPGRTAVAGGADSLYLERAPHEGGPESAVVVRRLSRRRRVDAEKYPRWQLDYLTLLAQRDLPNWGLPAEPQLIQRLLRMLAALHGQTLNASQLGQSLGLSYHTVHRYLDFLAGASWCAMPPST